MPSWCKLLLALTVSLCLDSTAMADWPHLRGVNYDGVSTETDLAEAWPAAGPPLCWTRDLGQGHSGFIVAEGKVFTQRQTLGGQDVLCLDPDSGETIWTSRYDWSWQPNGAYPGPYATPTWYRGRIYFSSPTGLVGCLDAKTGAALWSLNVREKFNGKGYGFGYAATPVVEDDCVVLPVGGPSASLVALGADDGRTIWTVGSDPASYSSAMLITFQGRRCVVGYLENALLIVELSTGRILFRQQLSSGYDEHSAWPLYQEPHLMLASPMRVPAKCYLLQPEADGSLLCTSRWTSKALSNDVISSVLYQRHIFGFDLQQLQASPHRASRGSFRCLEWSTGKLCWSTDDVGHATVAAADGKLILLNDEGSLILARADPNAYQELARAQVFHDETCWTPPTLWQGRLFARSPSRAVCVFVGRPENVPKGIATTTLPKFKGFWRFNPAWLVNRERDYPNDTPSWKEMTEWFAACVVIIFGGAALGTGLIILLARWPGGRMLPVSCLWLFLVFILGFLGPNLLSGWLDRFLFTWPASLYAAFHAVVLVCGWAEQHRGQRRARWLARLAILVFLSVGYSFFVMCKAIGMFIGWSFLFGFVPGFPFALLAVRAELRQQRLVVLVAWTLLAFAAFFWSCQGLLLWKSLHGGE
jgi:PQQ-like domain